MTSDVIGAPAEQPALSSPSPSAYSPRALQLNPRIVRWAETGFAIAITALLVVLHILHISKAGGLWRDEVGTYLCSALPSLARIFSSACLATPPFLPYGVMHGWIGWLGSSDTSLRWLGAMEGIGIVLALWAAGRLLGYGAPIFSLLLFGLNPLMLQWGDSPRGYGVALLLILLACGSVWKVIEAPTLARVVMAALASVLSVQCVFQNAVLLFAICLGGALVCLRRKMWGTMALVFAIGAVAAASLLPYAAIIRDFRHSGVVAQASPEFLELLRSIAAAFSPDNSLFLWTLVIGLCLGLVFTFYSAPNYSATSDATPRKPERVDSAIFGGVILTVGTFSSMLFFRKAGLPAYPWHLVPLLGCIAVSTDILVGQVRASVGGRAACLALASFVAVLAIPLALEAVPIRQTTVDVIADTVHHKASAGDAIIVNPWLYGISFQHYYHDGIPWMTVPPMETWEYSLFMNKMAQENPLQPVFAAMEQSLRSGHRVWVLGSLINIPKGQLPLTPPPAPNSPAGWNSLYYMMAWIQQLGYFIQSHAVQGGPVPLPIAQPVNPEENAPLYVFQGWRP